MNTKRLYQTLIVLICGLVVSGLAFAGSQAETTDTDMTAITISSDRDDLTVDPTAEWLRDPQANMFVPLLEYDYAAGKIIPAGATSYDVSADGRTYTFNIRKNWNWSNGEPVTAHDYEYGFKRIVDPETVSPIAWRIFNIVNASAINAGDMSPDELAVRAIDDYTLEITLTAPAAYFAVSLHSVGHAIPIATVEEFGEDWVLPENIVVNGPYKMTEWVQTDIMVLEKNPSYYNAQSVQIEKVTILHVPEASTAMAMYENDEIDTVDVPPEDLDRVKRDPVLSKEFYNGPRFVLYWYGFDPSHPPFDELLVRKAFAAAIDKQTLVEKITRGGQVAAPTMTPPGSFGHVPPSEGVGFPYDPEKAKAWLAEAGYPNGEGLATVALGYNSNELNGNIAQAIQKMWLDTLGVEVELKGFDTGYNDAVSTGAFGIHRHGWGMDFPDAHNVIGEVFRSKATQGDASFSRNLVIPEFDELADAAAIEQDPEKRYKMYVEAERLLVEEYVAQIPLFWYAQNIVTKPYLDRPKVPSFGQSWYLWKVNK